MLLSSRMPTAEEPETYPIQTMTEYMTSANTHSLVLPFSGKQIFKFTFNSFFFLLKILHPDNFSPVLNLKVFDAGKTASISSGSVAPCILRPSYYRRLSGDY